MDLETLLLGQSAIIDLLCPDAILDANARDRLSTLLRILNELISTAIHERPSPLDSPQDQALHS
jgi:hypothetical protein